MPISFNAIPIDIRVPGAYIEIDNSAAVRGLPGIPAKILVLGQRLAAGSVAEAVPVQVLTAQDAEAYFGRGSQLHRMFRALKANNRYTESWAIALDDDGAGVAAAGSIKFGGTVTAAGTLNLWLAGKRLRVAVAAAEASATTATNVVAAIAAATDLPVTAAVDGVDTTKVNITARNDGENGNFLDIRVNYYQDEKTPAGLTTTIVAMTGGSGNPDIADAIAVMGDEWYTDIVCPWRDSANLTALETELASRFGPLVMQDGSAYAAAVDTFANLATLGNARNSPHLSIVGVEGSPTPPEEWAAAVGGIAAYYTRIDPARPLQTLSIASVLPPAVEDRFTLEERNLHLYDGISTVRINDGGQVAIERMITTYKTNALGSEDPSFLDLNTMKTLALLRYQVRATIQLRYPRHKLADDGTRVGAGQAVVTPRLIRAELIALFRAWEEAGLAENIDQFKEDLIVERDAADVNRVNALIPPDIVNQFRVFAGKVEFRL